MAWTAVPAAVSRRLSWATRSPEPSSGPDRADVPAWKPGDRVTFDSTVYCGTCWFCRRGEINLCDNRRVLGVSCDDYRRQGAFAEYVGRATTRSSTGFPMA